MGGAYRFPTATWLMGFVSNDNTALTAGMLHGMEQGKREKNVGKHEDESAEISYVGKTREAGRPWKKKLEEFT